MHTYFVTPEELSENRKRWNNYSGISLGKDIFIQNVIGETNQTTLFAKFTPSDEHHVNYVINQYEKTEGGLIKIRIQTEDLRFVVPESEYIYDPDHYSKWNDKTDSAPNTQGQIKKYYEKVVNYLTQEKSTYSKGVTNLFDEILTSSSKYFYLEKTKSEKKYDPILNNQFSVYCNYYKDIYKLQEKENVFLKQLSLHSIFTFLALLLVLFIIYFSKHYKLKF